MTAHHVVAIFLSREVAERAREHLITHGFARDSIRLSTDRFDQAERGRAVQGQIEREQSNSGFFSWLFGAGRSGSDRSYYERHLTGERVALSVLTGDSHQGDVEDILDRYSPLDLYEEEAAHAPGERQAAHSGLSSGLGSISIARDQFTSHGQPEQGGSDDVPRREAHPNAADYASPAGSAGAGRRYRRYAANESPVSRSAAGGGQADWTIGPDGTVLPGNTFR